MPWEEDEEEDDHNEEAVEDGDGSMSHELVGLTQIVAIIMFEVEDDRRGKAGR